MFHPTRGGTRGGKDQFQWDDVKDDKHRENYLGHSLMAPVGRWQKGKDLTWYAKESKDDTKSKAQLLEIAKIKEAEAEAMAIALGVKKKKTLESKVTEDELKHALNKGNDDSEDEKSNLTLEKGLGYGKSSRFPASNNNTQEVQVLNAGSRPSDYSVSTVDIGYKDNNENKEKKKSKKHHKHQKNHKSDHSKKRHRHHSDSEDERKSKHRRHSISDERKNRHRHGSIDDEKRIKRHEKDSKTYNDKNDYRRQSSSKKDLDYSVGSKTTNRDDEKINEYGHYKHSEYRDNRTENKRESQDTYRANKKDNEENRKSSYRSERRKSRSPPRRRSLSPYSKRLQLTKK